MIFITNIVLYITKVKIIINNSSKKKMIEISAEIIIRDFIYHYVRQRRK